MTDAILVLNAGSSSLKFSVFFNAARGGPRISRAGSRVSAWVLPTNEELMIALHTRAVLAGAPQRG
jgi:acetate kinase